MRSVYFTPGQYYHIYNHGNDERKIFKSSKDYMRFLVSLIVFNDTNSSPHNLGRYVFDKNILINEYSSDERKRLVDIIAVTLLSNHYHLFVKEIQPSGISSFLHRLSKGYSRYFNLKYDRTGTLWQGSFGAKLIDEEAYFLHIISYIHLNILDMYSPEWRAGKIKKWQEKENIMKNFYWSSYGYYRRGKDDLFWQLLLQKQEWFDEYFSEPKDFEKNLKLWSQRNDETEE